MANKFTTKEILNKVLLDSSGNAVTANSVTTQEALNAALDTTNNRLNMSLAGGSISGDVTISGDLTVVGSATNTYDEQIQGIVQIVGSTGTGATPAGTLQLTTAETTVDDNDQLGRIEFLAASEADGSDSQLVGASIVGEAEATFAADNNSTALVFSTNTSAAATERMRITSDGNVGIGNTPEVSFHIKLADTATARIEDTSTDGIARLEFKNDQRESTVGLFGNSSDDFLIGHGGGTVISIDVGQVTTFAGDVKLSKASGSTTQSFVPASGQSSQIQFFQDDGSTQDARIFAPEGATKLAFEAGTTEMMRMSTTGIGIGTDSPDQTLHVFRGSAGTIDAVSSSGIVLEDDTSVFMQFLSPDNADVGLVFGDPDDNDIGGIFYEHANNKLAFRTNTTTALTINSSQNVGIGIASADTLLHVYKADASQTAHSDSVFAVENSGSTAISILSGGTSHGQIHFGDSGDADDGVVGYDQDTSKFYVLTKGSTTKKFQVDQNGASRFQATADTTVATFKGFEGNNGTIEIHADEGDTNAVQWRIIANTSGELGIGNYSTGAWVNHIKLDANSRFSMSNNDAGSGGEDSTSGNTIFGYLAGAAIDSDVKNNTLFGHKAGTAINGGDWNVMVGEGAGKAVTDGHENVFVGQSAGATTTSVGFAVGIGQAAMGSANVTSAADGSVAIGASSLAALTSGEGNTAVGFKALNAVQDAPKNTAVGYEAGMSIVSTSSTVGKGTYIGYQAGKVNTGRQNTFVGSGAGVLLTTGISNVAIGADALKNANTSESNNVCIGNEAGRTLDGDSTSGNTIIGQDANGSSAGAVNQTVLGQGATGVADNAVTLGNASVTAVYMAQDGDATINSGKLGVNLGTTAPSLHIDATGGSTTEFEASFATYRNATGGANLYMRHSRNNTVGSHTVLQDDDTISIILFQGSDGDEFRTGGSIICKVDGTPADNDMPAEMLFAVNSGAATATTRLTIAPAGTVSGDLNDTSDIGLKENIKTINDGLSIVKQMNPVTFDWKEKNKGSNSGFVAQEIEKILPNDVIGKDYIEPKEGEEAQEIGKSINVTGIVAHLTKAVQELSAKVEELESKL